MKEAPALVVDVQEVIRPLGISERSAVLAAAISIDFDYFRQDSSCPSGVSFCIWWHMRVTAVGAYPEHALC